MPAPSFLFLTGLHRSGTSLLHEILREHPAISGFSDTGAIEDEGQHLQNVFPPGNRFGGPGRFAFDPAAAMDESHPLATPESARRLMEVWGPRFDLSRRYLVEKSPPTLIRTRFFQAIFPGSRFLVILRHPVAVAYATRKWSHTTIPSLLEHTLTAYERFLADRPYLHHCRTIHYERFVSTPREQLAEIAAWLELSPPKVDLHHIRSDINRNYFTLWEADRRKLVNRLRWRRLKELEPRANRLGYSLLEPETPPGPISEAESAGAIR
jgi:hypothetical protein